MREVVGEPQLCEAPPFGDASPLLLDPASIRTEGSFLGYTTDVRRIEHLIQILGAKTADHLECSLPNRRAVGPEPLHIDAGAEVGDLIICHPGADVGEGHVQT